MSFSFKLTKKDNITRARNGIVHTPHGDILTPAFSPVATKATVKSLTPDDLKEIKTQVVLANAYHLNLQPGIETISKFGGFAPFMNWTGPTITDSGGYQVSFMWSKEISTDAERAIGVKISDNGATFRSHIDGNLHTISPEKSMEIQYALGADIIMAFDQPLSPRFSEQKNKEAFRRTLLWEERSFKHWQKLEAARTKGSYQALFGIIQGGLNKKRRVENLKFILQAGFPGIAIGDETIGTDPHLTAASLDTVNDLLPDDKPLHALGLGGGPEGIFTAISRGVDLFDNSSITRMARTGLLFIFPEDGGTVLNKFRTDISKSKYKNSKKPISKKCMCPTCTKYSASYLHHLFRARELLGVRLATIHNIYYMNNLMETVRSAISKGDYVPLKTHWLGH